MAPNPKAFKLTNTVHGSAWLSGKNTKCGIVQGYINGAEPHPPALATPISSSVPVIRIEHHQAKPLWLQTLKLEINQHWTRVCLIVLKKHKMRNCTTIYQWCWGSHPGRQILIELQLCMWWDSVWSPGIALPDCYETSKFAIRESTWWCW